MEESLPILVPREEGDTHGLERDRTPSEKLEQPIAKATYVKGAGLWRVFWLRADLKWHRYDPMPAVGSLERFLALVDEDKHACFFG